MRHLRNIILIGLLIIMAFVAIAFFRHRSNETSPIAGFSDAQLRQLELSYLNNAVDKSIISYASIEIPGLENISTSSDNGLPYLAMRLYPGQPKKNNGIRSEVSIDYPYGVGDMVTYSWQFRIPGDFPSDAPQNRWWVLADWHDQPDKNKGETWDTYAGIGQSAPIIFGYGMLDGKDMIGFSYGHDLKPVGTFSITKNVWHTIVMTVKWSQGADGSAVVYIDGNKIPIFRVTGPNMHNAYQHYMKVGMYRHPDIATENVINLRKIMITKP